jgi:hypothetical protein
MLTKEEMNFREFVWLLQEYAIFFWNKKFWILICALFISVSFVVMEWRALSNYSARLTFMVNEESNNDIGGVGAILGQFGLGGPSSSEYNLDKIVDLGGSRRIVESVLLDSIEIEGERDLMSNHIIKIYNYHERWFDSKNENLRGYLFASNNEAEYERIDNLVLGMLYELIIGAPNEGRQGLISLNYVDQTGILNVSSSSKSEELSLELSRSVYVTLSEFYVEKSIEKQRATLQKLEVITDSLSHELSKVEYELAVFQDRSTSLLQNRDRLNNGKMRRDAQVLTIIYGEAVKNRETARFVLDSKKPFFQIIDKPRYPLVLREKSYPKQALIGGLFGSFLGVVFFGFRKAYQDAMGNNGASDHGRII